MKALHKFPKGKILVTKIYHSSSASVHER